MIPIYYSPKLKHNYTDCVVVCVRCSTPCSVGFLFVSNYVLQLRKNIQSPLSTTHMAYCGDCMVYAVEYGTQVSRKWVVLVNELPDDSILIQQRPASLVPVRDDLSVWDAGGEKLNKLGGVSEGVVDTTVYAGRLSLEGATVGTRPLLEGDVNTDEDRLVLDWLSDEESEGKSYEEIFDRVFNTEHLLEGVDAVDEIEDKRGGAD